MHFVREVVVGTDFSPGAHYAVLYAGELAKALGAGLTVVHVDEKAAVVPGSDLAKVEGWSDRARMDGLVRELVERDVRARGVVRSGLPARGLCEAATEQNADLLVLGVHARGCLPSAVLGSVAERVLREAPCPVVMVGNR
jgi:nucleotide-binding universal stress UspA family protein